MADTGDPGQFSENGIISVKVTCKLCHRLRSLEVWVESGSQVCDDSALGDWTAVSENC